MPVHKHSDENLDLVFRALGDRTRRQLLARLSQGSAMVTELAEPFDMSLPAVGKHLRVLEKAGLVKRTITGRVHRCALDATPLRTAEEWLAHYRVFWGETLDALEDYVRKDAAVKKRTRRKARK
ncbi:MAG: metalloregulator ArsR/SmtB family transcription factor [Pseudomonadota bacterium]